MCDLADLMQGGGPEIRVGQSEASIQVTWSLLANQRPVSRSHDHKSLRKVCVSICYYKGPDLLIHLSDSSFGYLADRPSVRVSIYQSCGITQTHLPWIKPRVTWEEKISSEASNSCRWIFIVLLKDCFCVFDSL